jgi:hypothetical protein
MDRDLLGVGRDKHAGPAILLPSDEKTKPKLLIAQRLPAKAAKGLIMALPGKCGVQMRSRMDPSTGTWCGNLGTTWDHTARALLDDLHSSTRQSKPQIALDVRGNA